MMFSSNFHDQTIIEISNGVSLAMTIESFLIDRKAASRSPRTIKFYRAFLKLFSDYCDANSLKLIRDISADFLRRYFLALSETHNAGGVHCSFRTLRAFFRWLMDEEIMPPEWKNPMRKVKPPKVILEPLQPISLEDVKALVEVCASRTPSDDRDRAIFLVLLDTGTRAQELCDIDREDADLNDGSVTIRHGKGGKTRMVFLGRRTRRALRAYLRHREDHERALFVSTRGDRITYDALLQMLERRALQAKLSVKPTLHAFRRAFALNMLRNGVDVFALQKLLGHADLQIMRRYLAQNTQDTQLAHMRGSPVDNGL